MNETIYIYLLIQGGDNVSLLELGFAQRLNEFRESKRAAVFLSKVQLVLKSGGNLKRFTRTCKPIPKAIFFRSIRPTGTGHEVVEKS